MATMTAKPARSESIPRAMRARVEALLEENYAFMDSPIFKQRNIEKSLFAFEEHKGEEPALPRTSWYQPTRDEALNDVSISRITKAGRGCPRGHPLLSANLTGSQKV